VIRWPGRSVESRLIWLCNFFFSCRGVHRVHRPLLLAREFFCLSTGWISGFPPLERDAAEGFSSSQRWLSWSAGVHLFSFSSWCLCSCPDLGFRSWLLVLQQICYESLFLLLRSGLCWQLFFSRIRFYRRSDLFSVQLAADTGFCFPVQIAV
jgi:hypothetical protein